MTGDTDDLDAMSDSTEGRPPAPAQPVSTLALLLVALDPTAADRLLVAHVPDRLGCCRGCELPQAGPVRWPCTLHAVAVAAKEAACGRRRAPR